MHSTITVSYDFCWFKSFSFVLLLFIVSIIIIIIIIIISSSSIIVVVMPWDARDFLADFYSLNYSAGDAVAANLVEFACDGDVLLTDT